MLVHTHQNDYHTKDEIYLEGGKEMQPLWQMVSCVLKKSKVCIPHDPAILPLGVRPTEMHTQYSTVFIAALCVIVNNNNLIHSERECIAHIKNIHRKCGIFRL